MGSHTPGGDCGAGVLVLAARPHSGPEPAPLAGRVPGLPARADVPQGHPAESGGINGR